ncbi:histone-lysine N-methyltransferase trithorax-like isoform X2 [Planococcus citri]|uniref:histone-lysine N-methyltransferase trithorax-like isoform X2 n=1 Tax=Planococcus citri TaxID=170843 RepID=UPI0031F73210
MVKFKFPGKPSKMISRSLVSAYSVVVPSCDTSSISEDLCFGLSLFQSTFGDDDNNEPFNGFTNEDIDEAKFAKRNHETYLREKMTEQGLYVPAIPLTKITPNDNLIIETPSSRKSNTNVTKKKLIECPQRQKGIKLWRQKRMMMNRYHPKIQIRHNFKSLNKNSLMRFKHKPLSANYLSDRYCRKFILPSRSLHSSRVIKPNKRFIDHDRNYKLKTIKGAKTDMIDEERDYNGIRSDDSDTSCGGMDKKRAKIDPPSSKVIIREARLNITSETTITGPFSAKKFIDKESRSGVITCGICGSVRFYKYILQTRKFGIYSCEPCRRFILKMIKYSKQPNSEILKCKAETGVGKCVILPVTPNRRKESEDPLKSLRCNACLLSLCLQKYIMPASIKKSLIQLIPEEVKSNYLNGLSPPDLKKPYPILDHPLSGICKPVQLEEGHDKLRKRLNMLNYLRNVRCSKRTLDKGDTRGNKSASYIHKRNTLHQKITTRNKVPQESARVEENFTEKEPYLPRGPRIKHVCRSASSVLKTSSNDKEIEETPCPLSEADCARNLRKNSETKLAAERPSSVKIRQCDDSIPILSEQASDSDSTKANAHYGARTLQDFGKDSSDESDENEDKLISTDFWEAYDPDEVYKTGFPLISSELLNVRALCFLCGSAGIEKLLYCVSCCEPYHWYCAEGPSAFRDESELEKCRVSWVCRKCKVCSACGERDSRILTSCQRCKNSYHDECLTNKALNKRLFKSDRPWVCSNCLKCKSCNSTSVFTYVGNIPLCSECFKLRQKGSFCPLCQRCYQDDDYNVKMMECGICEKWIHAKCEGISHEKYQILSFLPDTIEFVCRLCCSVPPAQWWLAVEDELKAGYLGILKSLCKNKKVSDLFKESPRKNICRCATTTANKLTKKPRSFSISDADSISIDSGMEIDSSSSASEMTKTSESSSSVGGSGDKNDDSDADDGLKSVDCEGRSVTDSATDGGEWQQQKCSYCCYNSETRNKINNDLLSIKAKVHNNQYSSLLNFHQELISVIDEVEELDLIQTYRDSLKKFFPWFDPNSPELNDDETENADFAELSSTCNSTLGESGTSSIRCNDSTVIESASTTEAEEKEYDNLRKLMFADEYNYDNFKMLDLRKCNLCKGTGEAIPSEGGRLIYCGRNEWVHSNCALWSSEVFEEIDGSLQNIHSAISRGRQIRCSVCDKKGASVGCCYKNCTLTYHFLCAKKASCVFLQNRTIYCQNHDTNEVTLPFLTTEKDFEILRPVYIETDRKKKKLECHSSVKLRIGSLHVENLGKIDPHLSDNPKYILPIYYRCTRLFWSTTKPWKIVQYHIQIKLRYCYQPNGCDSEINYTVDHSQSKDGSMRDTTSVEASTSDSDNEIVKHLVNELVNKIASSKEDYSTTFISSQAGGGDILSPELQEAIYKDLPNDLLNDRTLHDIWTNYDDALDESDPTTDQSNDRNTTGPSIHPPTLITGKKPPHIVRALANLANRAAAEDKKDNQRTKKVDSSNSLNKVSTGGKLASVARHRLKSPDDGRSSSKNSKYLRDKNICEAETASVVAKKTTLHQSTSETTLGSTLFYNELCNKVKRKIDFENSSMMAANTSLTNSKKKHYDVTPIDFYHEAAERTFKPTYVQSYESILQLDGMVDISDEEPVKCIRCHRTYRTSFSFERHLDVCNSDDFNDYMISSCESDTSSEEEKIAAAESAPTMVANVYDSMGQQHKYMFTMDDHQSSPASIQYATAATNVCSMAAAQNTVYSFAGTMQQNHIQAQQQQHVGIAPQAAYIQKQECITVTSQPPQQQLIHQDAGIKFNVIGVDDELKQEMYNSAALNGISGAVVAQPVSTQSYQMATNMAQPTYVIQSFPKQEMIPTYVAVDNSITECIQPQPQLQLHQPQMNFQPVIPTILGTVMQPSVIETPTYIINTAPTSNGAELFAPQGNIILPNQPTTMLFGMETVVSNTVMSSSQFMSSESHLAGNMGSSTMYQTTTTQVFQAAKQMPPPQPIPASGFIVVNSPIQQMSMQQQTAMQKPVQIQTTSGTAVPEKYMYVQVNPQNMANFKAAEKPKPIITKTNKNNIIPKDKPTKVLKIKNNKPVITQKFVTPAQPPLAPSVFPNQPTLAPQTYQIEKPVTPAVKNGYVASAINGRNFRLNNANAISTNQNHHVPVSVTMPMPNAAISPRKYTQQPVPVAQVVPRQNPMLAQKKVAVQETATNTNSPKLLSPKVDSPNFAGKCVISSPKVINPKVDKCINTDNEPGICKPLPVAANRVSTACAGTNTVSLSPSQRTIQISYTIDDKSQQTTDVDGNTTAAKSWQLNIPVEEPAVRQSVPKIEPQPNLIPKVTPKPATVPVPQINNKVSQHSMPRLDFFSDAAITKKITLPNHTKTKIEIKSESEQLFDELLRQHMLSMENIPTPNVDDVKPKSESNQASSPAISPVPQPQPNPPKPKPISKPLPRIRYKPQLNIEAAKTPSSPALQPEDPSSLKLINGKKKVILEKENLNKLQHLVNETSTEGNKNWKTASISFEVNAEDGFTYKTNDLKDLWNKIIESVQKSRAKYKLPLLPKNAMVNADSIYGLLGFENNASKYLLEQLPDAWKCIFYKPVFHKSPLQNCTKSSPMKNESGCARTEPFNSSHKYDMFGWLASRHRKPPKFMMISDADIVNGNRLWP